EMPAPAHGKRRVAGGPGAGPQLEPQPEGCVTAPHFLEVELREFVVEPAARNRRDRCVPGKSRQGRDRERAIVRPCRRQGGYQEQAQNQEANRHPCPAPPWARRSV